jgi:hypothetical protein
MDNFSKIMYLPSGGLSYSPFVFLKPITLKINFLETDQYMIHSTFERILYTINEYVKFDTSVLEVYIQDIYYLWMYYINTDFQNEYSRFNSIKTPCKHCYEINNVMVDFTDADVFINNKYSSSELKPVHVLKIDNIEIETTYRTVKHNIEFSQLALSYTEKDDVVLKTIYYILTQVTNITMEGRRLNKNEWLDALSSLSLKQLTRIYNAILEIEFHFGVYSNLMFTCFSCGKETTSLLFNNFYLSQLQSLADLSTVQKQEEIFDYMLNFVRLPLLNFEELTSIPVRLTKSLMQSSSKIKFHAGVVL